jgi:hypothetical protein
MRNFLTGQSSRRGVWVAVFLGAGVIISHSISVPYAPAASARIAPVKLTGNEMSAICAYSEGKSSGKVSTGYRCEMGVYSKSKQASALMVCSVKRECSVELPDGSPFPEPILSTMKSLILFVVSPTDFASFCKKRTGAFKDNGSGYLKCAYKASGVGFTAYRDNDSTVVFSDAGVLTPKAAHDLFGRKL